MNIIEKIRAIVQGFPKIAEICDTVHVDFPEPSPTDYGISSLGDTLITEDILGNQIRQHSFMLRSTFSAINDYERMSNSGVLLELAQYLDSKADEEVEHEIDGIVCTGTIRRITTANGTLAMITNGNVVNGWFYQLQIVAEYTVDKEKITERTDDL